MSDVCMSARPPKRQTFVVGIDMLQTCQSTCQRHHVKTCRHGCWHDMTIMSAADMLVPCRKILAKKLLWVHFFRLNQHTTIKYCNAAVLLGDGGGAVAFWEVCWAAVEGCSGGVWRQRRRKMWRDVTARRDSLQRWEITHQQDAMTRRNDEMQCNGTTIFNANTQQSTKQNGCDKRQRRKAATRQYATQWQDMMARQDATTRCRGTWQDDVTWCGDETTRQQTEVLTYVSGSLLCRTRHTCQAEIGDISTRRRHVADMLLTFPAKLLGHPNSYVIYDQLQGHLTIIFNVLFGFSIS